MKCPWEQKATVMRQLHERYRGPEAESVDGVKVNLGDAWVLILPDPDRPSFTVCAEAGSNGQAAELVEEYARVVEVLVGE